MTRVLVDETLRARLHNFAEPLELVDGSGRIVCRVIPELDLSQYEPWEPPIDEAEMRRREQSTEKRYTTQEVLDYLERL